MENCVETAKEFVAVKRIAGISDNGLIKVELADGTMIGLSFHPTNPELVGVKFPSTPVVPVFEDGVLIGCNRWR